MGSNRTDEKLPERQTCIWPTPYQLSGDPGVLKSHVGKAAVYVRARLFLVPQV